MSFPVLLWASRWLVSGMESEGVHRGACGQRQEGTQRPETDPETETEVFNEWMGLDTEPDAKRTTS